MRLLGAAWTRYARPVDVTLGNRYAKDINIYTGFTSESVPSLL